MKTLIALLFIITYCSGCTTTTLMVDGKPEKAWRLDIPIQVFGLAMGPAAAVATTAEMIYVLNDTDRYKPKCAKDEICEKN